jgi:hypothetical protein
VKEVVREPRMHFYRVPRLGSFMAVPLIYNSCLFEDALDNAVHDYLETVKHREEQEKAKEEWLEEKQREREDHEKAGDTNWEPESREWEEVLEKPFDMVEERYVICLDTLGQDRELADDDKRFALTTIKNFKEIWEKTEQENLKKDRNRKLEIIQIDKDFTDNDAPRL